jgi:diguanylate cyclase
MASRFDKGRTFARPSCSQNLPLMVALDPLLMAVSFLLATGLMWLGSELAVTPLTRPQPYVPVATGCALLACGLWWPGYVVASATGAYAADELKALYASLPCLVLAVCVGVTGALARHKQTMGVVVGALVTLIAAYGHTAFTAPGLLRSSPSAGGMSAGVLLLLLCTALVLAQWPWQGVHRGRAVRALAACVAATGLCWGAALSAEAPLQDHWFFWTELVGLCVLLAVAGALNLALSSSGTEEFANAARAARHSAVDSLTGLPTRLFFENRLNRAAQKCTGRGSAQLAVFFIDLDGFKPVNDTFGHSIGDRVLEQVGERIKSITRKNNVAARVGGDEFVLLTEAIGSQDAVTQAATRVIELLSKPYRVDERDIAISCSVGIALFPDDCDPNKLIARADAAMYAAKRAGGSRHRYYAREMDADVQQDFDMLRDLREALVNNEFELFFQPKVDARSGKVTASEALLRWQHPTRGTVMPGQFIPLAERSGLIGPLGDWVIEAACAQARAWRDKGLRMRVAINLSAYQMRQDDIADRIAEALKRHRIHPSLLTCEITESAAMEDTRATQETFRRLGELGAHLSIDDFGTGYSSLSYLRRLPAEELKIDQSFVKDIESGSDARAVVDAVVKLAHALGLKVVAEGVENPRQQKILIELGCDELQGFLFAKPMTARALLLWALGDRAQPSAFSESLFGETCQSNIASPPMSRPSVGSSVSSSIGSSLT